MNTKEVVLSRYSDENTWTVDTSDAGFAKTLESRGWSEENNSGPYRRFMLPKKAITIRRRASVEKKRPRPVWLKSSGGNEDA